MNQGNTGFQKNRILLMGIFFLLLALLLLLLLFRVLAESGVQGIPRSSGEKERKAAPIHLFQKIPDLTLSDNEGKKITLKTDGKINVWYFWASDCSYCQEGILRLDELAQTAEEMGAGFFPVARLDRGETKEQTLLILEEKRIQTHSFLDEDRKIYEELGLHMVPTLLVTDGKGRLIAMSSGSTPAKEELRKMIGEAEEGKADTFSRQVMKLLGKEDGGIRTNGQTAEEGIPAGADVLSESLGIFMEYAALSGNKELYNRLWIYARSWMFAEGFLPWVITDKSETKVNALVDDLRVLGAMQKAGEAVSEPSYRQYVEAIYRYNVEAGKPVDFYDVGTEEKASRFTLCYGDLATLKQIGETDRRYRAVYKNTLHLIRNGRISEKFPLYYSYYDYALQKYEGTRLHMAEAMTTLLHLAEVGELPEEAMEWIAEEMEEGCVYAAYDTEGNPAADGYYESTSVYALIVMTALAEGRMDIAGEAIQKMEQFRITDGNSRFYGIFGNPDGTGMYSFDQGMALLAYESYERSTE